MSRGRVYQTGKPLRALADDPTIFDLTAAKPDEKTGQRFYDAHGMTIEGIVITNRENRILFPRLIKTAFANSYDAYLVTQDAHPKLPYTSGSTLLQQEPGAEHHTTGTSVYVAVKKRTVTADDQEEIKVVPLTPNPITISKERGLDEILNAERASGKTTKSEIGDNWVS